MVKCKKKLWKRDFECKYCKDISKIEIQCSWCFFDAFLFQHSIKGNCLCYSWPLKLVKNSKFTKDQGIFADWTVDGAQYAFHENCLY